MCVKFKAKQSWSGTFFKDRQWTTEETWKIIVSLRSRCKLHDPTHFPHFCNVFSLISRYFCSCVLFLLFFFVGHSSFLQNWLAMDLQGVTNSLATSGKPGTACDFAFAANMLFQLKVVCGGGMAVGMRSGLNLHSEIRLPPTSAMPSKKRKGTQLPQSSLAFVILCISVNIGL